MNGDQYYWDYNFEHNDKLLEYYDLVQKGLESIQNDQIAFKCMLSQKGSSNFFQ